MIAGILNELIDLNRLLKRIKQDIANKEDTLKWLKKQKTPFLQEVLKVKKKKGTDAAIEFLTSNKAKGATDELFDYDNALEYAEFLRKQNDLQESLIIYEKLLKVNLTDEKKAGILNNLAALRYKLNQNQQALKEYEEALKMRKNLVKKDINVFGIDYAESLIFGVYYFNQPEKNLNEAKKILQNFRGISKAERLLKMIKTVKQ